MRPIREQGMAVLELTLFLLILLPIMASGVAVGLWEYDRHIVATRLDAIELRDSPQLTSLFTSNQTGTQVTIDSNKVKTFLQSTNTYLFESINEELIGIPSGRVFIESSMVTDPEHPSLAGNQNIKDSGCTAVTIDNYASMSASQEHLLEMNITVWIKLDLLSNLSYMMTVPSCVKVTKVVWLRKHENML